jgi:Tol biopolymer transport system component
MTDLVRHVSRALLIAAALALLAPGSALGAFPGQNGRIAFFSDREAPNPERDSHSQDIYTMDADGNDIFRASITTDPRQSVHPAWNAQGTKIAYTSTRDMEPLVGQDYEIWVMDPDGTGSQITYNTDEDTDPTWSPDGGSIAYTKWGQGIFVMNADGSGQRQLTSTGAEPSWSPDGTQIAFNGDGADIWVTNADGTGTATRITSGPAIDHGADWSPDGSKLAFTRFEYLVGEQIYVVNAGGTGETRLTDGEPFGDTLPAWSPDGSKVAFTRYVDEGSEIYAVNADGTGVTPLTNNTFYDVAPSWQPLPVADSDGDGVADSIDVGSRAFADGSGTSGEVIATRASVVTIVDAPDPEGVRISVGAGGGGVDLRVCGGFFVRLARGSEVVVTCGSVSVTVIEGQAEVVLGEGLTVVSVPAGTTAKVSENTDGTFNVENLGGEDVTVSVDGIETTVPAGTSKDVRTWDFRGFARPVENNGALNVARAGRSVPLKWRLRNADGTPVTGLGAVALTVTSFDCATGEPDGEEPTVDESPLQPLGNGHYRILWRTSRSFTRSCKAVHLDLGEGVTHDAYFQFTR